MKRLIKMSYVTTFLLTGCASDFSNLLDSHLDQNAQKSITFETNQVYFMHSLHKNTTKEERNVYLDEFILKSDMQCQNYLNTPLAKEKVDESKNSLYMSMFDTVSNLFGISLATNAAKAVFLGKEMRNINAEVSGYRKMVLFVMFDISTETKKDLEKYRKFRKKLLDLGFIMFQYSVYVRFCNSLVIAQKYEKKIEDSAPTNGSIRIMKITESQYSNMITIENYREKPEEKVAQQGQTFMVF